MRPSRLFERLLLRPEDVPPSREDFEVVGAFNPGAVAVGAEVVLLVRVAERVPAGTRHLRRTYVQKRIVNAHRRAAVAEHVQHELVEGPRRTVVEEIAVLRPPRHDVHEE